jgi:DNA phosphorothioation-associated DGQHR protein 1
VDKEYRDIELLCSIYLDLPLSYQAYIFATINFNQKKVDRSLAYELFGYNLENEPEESWSPDKLSVSLTRKLNLDSESPFYKHILIAAQDDHILFEVSPKKLEWYVSTATVVDGIINLISSNSKRDRDALYKYRIGEGRHRKILQSDNAPLRNLYLSINDLAIYKTVLNFFTAANNTLFHQAQKNSYVRKTVGIQALFDVLREILTREFSEKKDIRIEYFSQKLQPASVVDFSNNFFQASGVGRSRIRNILLVAMEYTDIEKVKQERL